jgi:hypothetical protein
VVHKQPQAAALEESNAPAVSAWWSVPPPRWQKPVKLNEASVGVAQLSPSSWHI